MEIKILETEIFWTFNSFELTLMEGNEVSFTKEKTSNKDS